ncbi:MAG: TatD family hydrolase [Abditibacteriales bacterium]|nr:TatD family hydrolase [Abditibacteriales bacterium]
MFIDSHCHLSDPKFAADYAEVLLRARQNDVGIVINIGSHLANSGEVLAQAEACDGMFATVGVHPHEASSWDDDTSDALRQLAQHPKVVGIGETGLDFHYDLSPRAQQERAFRQSICLARELQLPLVIHNREADALLLNVLRAEDASAVGGVVHCFTSDLETARAVLDLGFYIGFTGIITFPKSQDLREVVKFVPIERTLIETDAPYCAPVPHRGKRNEPAFVRHVAEKIAEVKGIAVTEVRETTTANARRLFRLGALP